MPWRLSVVFFFTLYIFFCLHTKTATAGNCGQCTTDLRNTLTQLYQATNGPQWRHNTNWLNGTDCLQWERVDGFLALDGQCQLTLELRSNDLTGTLPDDFWRRLWRPFRAPIYVEMSWNDGLSGELPSVDGLGASSLLLQGCSGLSGTISAGVGGLRGATVALEGTRVSGTLPDVSDLWNARLLLSETRISGTLPSSMVMNNSKVDLSDSLVSGDMPSSLTIHGESILTLDGVYLDGELPKVWDASPGASLMLDLVGLTQLSGSLPDSIPGLSKLYLDASSSSIGGTISPAIGAIVRRLNVRNSAVTGQLPDMENCILLDVSGTPVTGSLPRIRSGTLLANLCESIEGTIPAYVGLGEVRKFEVRNSRVSGELPDFTLGQDSRGVTYLALTDTLVSGTIPTALCDHRPTRVDISFTSISGAIPDCLTSVDVLNLEGSEISTLPNSILFDSNLHALSVASTPLRLSGPFASSPLCQAMRRNAIYNVDLSRTPRRQALSSITFCLLGQTQVTTLRLSHVSMMPILWPSQSSTAPGNRMYQSDTLQLLDLSGCGLVSFEANLGGVVQVSDLPSLEVLDLSWNPDLGGPVVPDLFAHINHLDISYTAYRLCGARSLFGSNTLRSLTIFGLPAPYADCSHLVEPGRALLRPSTVGVRPDPYRELVCPQWVLVNNKRSTALLHSDSAFLDFYLCQCASRTQYFGRSPEAESQHFGALSWDEYLGGNLNSSDVFSCFQCPESLSCVQPFDPRQGSRHAIVGSKYPMYKTSAGWAFLPERFRLPHAVLLKCQHKELCNTRSAEQSGHVHCREGHVDSSLLCSKCEANYFRVGLLCYECAPGAKWSIVPVFCVAIAAYVVFLARRNFHKPGIAVSVGLFYLQLGGVLEKVNQQLRSASADDDSVAESSSGGFFVPVQAALAVLASFNPFALDCLDSSLDFEVRSWLMYISPFLIMLIVSLLFVVFEAKCSTNVFVVLGLWHRHQRYKRAALYTLNVLVFPVAYAALSVLSCESPDTVSGEVPIRFLGAAPWIECHSATHSRLIAGAVVALLAFVVPMIAVVFHQARRAHSRPLDGFHLDDDYEPLSGGDDNKPVEVPSTDYFLTVSLRPELWWWPVTVLQARAVALALATSLIPIKSSYLPVSVFFILFVSLLAHVVVKPYRRPIDNALEALVLLAAVMRYMSNLLSGINGHTGGESVISFLLTLAVLACVVLALLWSKLRRRLDRAQRHSVQLSHQQHLHQQQHVVQ